MLENITVMNRDVYNFSFQIEYGRQLKKNSYIFFSAGYSRKDFKSEVILGRHTLQFLSEPRIQKFSFINYNCGFKNYFGKLI